MRNRSNLVRNIVTAVILGEFIIYVLGFPISSFGFWALYIQLEGCAIIIFLTAFAPTEAKKTVPKTGQA